MNSNMNSTIARNGPEQCDLVRYVSVANQYEVGRCDVTLDSARAHDLLQRLRQLGVTGSTSSGQFS